MSLQRIKKFGCVSYLKDEYDGNVTIIAIPNEYDSYLVIANGKVSKYNAGDFESNLWEYLPSTPYIDWSSHDKDSGIVVPENFI